MLGTKQEVLMNNDGIPILPKPGPIAPPVC